LEIRRTIVTDGGADDHDAVEHSRRRRDDVVAAIANADALREIDFAVRAEVGARLAGHRIDGEETRIERAGEDATCAWTLFIGSCVFPHAHATRGSVAVRAHAIDARVVTPALLARLRIERDDYVRRRLEIQMPEREHRRGLEREFVGPREALA